MAQRPLIGTSPNQVSTNGMLGDLAFQDSNGAYIETIRGAVNLDKLDKEITDTAVDVFVYDTRKDSDGGAWRKRTQHTSWYNETLNTATRGSRKEFPAVAVIVAESDTVTIYDGDDPDMPMWMVFNVANDKWLKHYSTASNCSCVTALNGEMVTGGNGTGNRLSVVRFIHDNGYVTEQSFTYRHEYISTRNSTPVGPIDTINPRHIVNILVNDVAMTVLPNAPIDDATGLPIPTIAVATDGGASVIKDDGNVYDDTDATALGSVDFNDDYRIISTRKATGSAAARFFISKRIDTVSSDSAWLYEYYTGNFVSGYPRLRSEDTGAGITLGLKGDTSVRGSNIGFTLWDVNSNQIGPNEYSTNSLLCGISTSYNTGWMHGDIKGAFLSDTDATNVSADTLNSVNTFDGTFATSTGWTTDSDWTISGGVATCNGADAGRFIYPTTDRWPIGASVVVQVTVSSYTSGSLYVSYSTGGATTSAMTGTGTYVFVNNVSGNDLIYFRSESFVGSIDNVKIYYAEEDRSVNNKGLAVYGTITKSAVATGAELVGYSGFSANTYLKKPYDANINFGTNDFSIILWCKSVGNGYQQTFISNLQGTGSDGYYLMRYNDSGNWYFGTATGGSGLYTDLTKGNLTDGIWHCLCVTKSGGYANLYQDGKHILIDDVKSDVTVSTSTELKFSRFTDSNNLPLNGSMALVRISGSIPSAEQIKKIYEDEKVLFQENAACTLYGSSDAVTALAYDEDLQLLHVGTSSGRSDFQGLRRINNTTTAVTTAISASNGLVAEQ